MADKTQNIFVNYKVNTAEVEKAQQLLNKVNQASNQFQQSAQSASSVIFKEFQKSNKSIEDMRTALTRLKSVMDVTTNPQKLKMMGAEYRNIKTQLDAAQKSAYGLGQAVKNQGNLAQQAAGQFGKLYGAVQTVVGAAIVRQVASFGIEMARLAGQTEGVERAFQRAFPNNFAILQQLRQATRGTITDFELMQRTLQATNLGLSVRELPELFEFAAVRAQQTGESVDYLVDSIVRGIGRKSPLILDNLGISAVALKDKFNGAALASQSVADVTKAVSEIAREEMAKMGGYVETAATKVDQMNVAWDNLRTNLSKAINSAAIIDFFTEAFNGMARLLKGQKEIEKESIQQRATIEFQSLRENQLADQRLKNGRLQNQTQQELIDATQAEIRERIKLIEAGKVELLILKQKFDQASHTKNGTTAEINANIKIREQISAQGANLVKNIKFYEETIKLLRNYFAELKKGNDAEVESTGIIERKRAEIKKIQEQIEKTNLRSDLGVGGALITQLEIAQAELNDLLRAFTDFKIPEFKIEVENAAQALSNFAEVSARVDAQLRKGGFQGAAVAPTSVYTPDNWQKLKDDFVDNWRDITSAGIDIQADQLHSLADMELANMELRLKQTQDFYDNQLELAGDNERAKQQIRLKEERDTKKIRDEIARKEKQAKRTHVIIDMAAGIAKAFATYPWPYSLIPAAFVAAQGASQLAIINRQPTGFAEGVIDVGRGVIGLRGPGTSKSDSIPAKLSRGESVMTALETRNAGDVLREIRARTLDNRKLRELKENRGPVVLPVDTDGVIKAIKNQKPPDVVKIANIVHESKQYNDDYKNRVRSRSMGI